jgi:CRP-like cAMP-binding protein
MSQIEQSSVRNRLLAALPSDDFAALAPAFQPVALDFQQVLHPPGRPIEAGYFPGSGMVSLLNPLQEGQNMEVGIIGREGLVGLAVVLGAESASTKAMVQMAGTAVCVPAAALREAFAGSAALRAVVLRYAQASYSQVAQTAACNGQHAVNERLARWMLMAHDRAEDDTFPMTQEFMALMLGVRRAGVTVAAGVLQKAGVIRCGYGRITILDRAGLEAASCECYGTVRRQYEGLLDAPVG